MSMRSTLHRVVLAVGFGAVVSLPSAAHPGHDSEPRQLPESRAREPAPQREPSDAPSSVGGGGGFEPGNVASSPGARALKAPHGGVLVRTAVGYAELLADKKGAVSLWWLDANGRARPASVALATVVDDAGAHALVLKPAGDRASAMLPTGKTARSIVVQAMVDGRTTTVRAVLADR